MSGFQMFSTSLPKILITAARYKWVILCVATETQGEREREFHKRASKKTLRFV